MFRGRENSELVSVKLSEVLSDIGVNERIVQKTRRAYLISDSMCNTYFQLLDCNSTSYTFGSQSEGTTTMDLDSDSDILLCNNEFNVIQDVNDWKPGILNFLMVQDETVSPGYCLLQLMTHEKTLLFETLPNNLFSDPSKSCRINSNTFRSGPALTLATPGLINRDIVSAFRCKSWPLQAQQWLDWQGVGQWPSADMKRDCASTGCFLVPVGSKGSKQEQHEHRISTSLAERCLMFSLNITQIRCYVMMKIIIKTFIKPYSEDTISSYMCKMVLFHGIANTHSNIWRENNILGCLSLCLFALHTCIMNENCPHFIIPGNNLMKGKIPYKDKPYILQKLCDVVANGFKALLEIKCDKIGLRLLNKMYNLNFFKTSDIVSGKISDKLAYDIDGTIRSCLDVISNSNDEEAVQTLLKYIYKVDDISNQCEGVDKMACQLFKQGFCTFLGTALASCSIRLHNIVSARALTWTFLGLDTDVSSGKLKLASIYYCTGDIQRADITLMDIERNYANTVQAICSCYPHPTGPLREEFIAIACDHNAEALPKITAFCVKFQPYVIVFVPHELKYEMFRYTKKDLAFFSPMDEWIKYAMVDSLPYLYFLQYKILGDEKIKRGRCQTFSGPLPMTQILDTGKLP